MLVQLGAGAQEMADKSGRAVAEKLAARGLVRVRVELNGDGHEARDRIEREEAEEE